jgi:hypothetical protein
MEGVHGPGPVGKSCVRLERLEDVDLDEVAALIREGAVARPAGATA